MSVSSSVVPEGRLTYREITACRACGSEQLATVLDLGVHAVSDFYATPPADETRAPLVLVRCGACSLVQLRHSVDRDRLYRQYWYRSGTNEAMVAALKDVVDDAMGRVELERADWVLDIGANDGTLLDQYPKWLSTRGYEPAANLVDVALDKGHIIIVGYFPPKYSQQPPRYKIITSIAMFYDLDDPNDFVAEIKRILHPDGVWVCQMMDLRSMLYQNAFDNICHEHVTYWPIGTFDAFIQRHGMQMAAASGNTVNGGSVRFTCGHKPLPFDPPWPNGPDQLNRFARRVQERKDATLALLRDLKKRGKTVLGYGASTKGNTLLQYYGITPDLLPAIAERNPDKVGKVTAGVHIPIISEAEMRERRPDYLLILPWHFLDGFMAREAALRESGTKFIVPLPDLRIV